MNKLAVIAKNLNTFFIKRLIEEVGEKHLLFINPWEEARPKELTQKVLVRTTGIHGDDKDLHFLRANYLPEQIINPLKALEPLRNKRTQYENFPRWGIPHLPWLNLEDSNHEAIEQFCRLHGRHFLIKPNRGQGGWGIQVFEYEKLIQWWSQAKDREYLLQPYMAHVREVRLFFIHDYMLSLEREKTQSAGANFKLGGTARLLTHHEGLDHIARIWRKESNQVYGAIDALIVNGNPHVLEINAVPGIEQLEGITGENILAKLLSDLNS